MYGAESKAGLGGSLERRKAIVTGLKSISSQIKKAAKVCTATVLCRMRMLTLYCMVRTLYNNTCVVLQTHVCMYYTARHNAKMCNMSQVRHL